VEYISFDGLQTTVNRRSAPRAFASRGASALVAAPASIVIGVLAAIVLIGSSVWVTGGPLSQVRPAVQAQPCPGSTTVQVGLTTYGECDAAIDWNSSAGGSPFGPTNVTTASLDGVVFDVYGYGGDCAVVNVTGHEPGGRTFSFLIYPVPDGCTFVQTTVFSPDGDFGATWTGGTSIELLVRAG